MMSLTVALRFVVISAVLFLTACGGGDSGSSTSNSKANTSVQNISIGTPKTAGEEIQIAGAGIKGPLAFADVKLFPLNPTFTDFYDRNLPVSQAMTNEFGQISGLSIHSDMRPPFIMTIGGANAIDLNTGTTPVIHTLVTVITQEMLASGQPIYATPLTTMAFQLARHGAGASGDTGTFLQRLNNASVQVGNLFSIDLAIDIDIFRSPLLINNSTVTASEQQEAVYHRAALEAFAAKTYALSVSTDSVTADSIIDRLALDLQSDGVIDNADNGTTIGAIDPAVLSKDPMGLFIPNTQYHVRDIMELMENERILLGTAIGPSFHKDLIALPVAASPAITTNSFPVSLQGTAPEEATVVMNVNKPADAGSAIVTLAAFDADFAGEGKLVINGNAPVDLFDPTASTSNDKLVVNVPITTPADYWIDGDNTLVFHHTSTKEGFIVQSAVVSFLAVSPVVYEPVIAMSTTGIQFGDQDVGGVTDAKVVKLTNSGNAPLVISSVSVSSDFLETNDCNNYLPADSTCTISVSFVPTKSSNISGALVISGDSDAGTYRVNLSGTGRAYSANVVTQSQSPGQVLHVDFDDHPVGPYTRQDAINDFDADLSTGPGWSSRTTGTDVIADPTGNSNRGNVMRITHLANKGGDDGGGPRFKARVPAKDEYYLSYDIFIPKSNELMKQEKMPGLMYGSMLDATHAYGVIPEQEGTKAFLSILQLLKPGTYKARGNTNQLTCFIYDADKVQYNRWFNLVDPVTSPAASTWSFPKGRWVTVEQRVKQNTATSRVGVGNRKDGILQTWVDGQLALDRRDMHWRTVNTMHIDGIFFLSFYGGSPTNPENKPSRDQYIYFDNFIASTSPITH